MKTVFDEFFEFESTKRAVAGAAMLSKDMDDYARRLVQIGWDAAKNPTCEHGETSPHAYDIPNKMHALMWETYNCPGPENMS